MSEVGGGRTIGVLMPCKLRDGQAHIIVTPEDMAVIAAAPAMLAALRTAEAQIVQLHEIHFIPETIGLRQIRAAIALAEKVER